MTFRSVVFDCDSTLARIEGIDELAGERSGEIRRMTELAMRGELALEEVYGHRLALIRPTREQVEALGRAYAAALVDDARETIGALRWLGKEVRILSGGLRPAVEALALDLGLERRHVAAVGIDFHADGAYRDYERASPLSRSGGKAGAIRAWTLPRPTLLVGDGATDLEARPAVDAFAAFAGVVHRPNVVDAAEFVIRHPCLAPVLVLATDPTERQRLRASPWWPVLEKGEELWRHYGS